MGGTVNFNWGEFCLISGQVSITSAQSRFQNPRSLDQRSGQILLTVEKGFDFLTFYRNLVFPGEIFAKDFRP